MWGFKCRFGLMIAIMLFATACVSERPGYYAATIDGAFSPLAAGQVRGEQCYFQFPQNGLVTDFADGLSIGATLNVTHETDSQGFRWEQPGIIELQIFARNDVRMTSKSAQVAVDGSPLQQVELEGSTQNARAKKVSPYSVFSRRRPFLNNETTLATLKFSVQLEDERAGRVQLQLPMMRIGQELVMPPAIFFERRSGIARDEICGEY